MAKNRQIVNIPDAYKMSGSEPYTFDYNFDCFTDYRTHSVLAVPMINQQSDLLGVLQVINAMDEKGNIIPFSRSYENMINHFATRVALAVERAQITRDLILRITGFEASDGKPLPKREEEIPLFGIIVAIADVYDALSHHRSYKEAWDERRILEEMYFNSGKQFDPELIKIFFPV